MDISLILACILAFLCLVTIVRANYVCILKISALDIVHSYMIHLIDIEEFEFNCDYYEEMIFSHEHLMLHIWKFGIRSAIKPEYLKILEPYINDYQNSRRIK